MTRVPVASQSGVSLVDLHFSRDFDPVGFRCEIGILKYENSSDGNANAAERRLSQCTPRRSVDEDLGPGFRIDLDGSLKRNGRSCGFIGLDVIAENGPKVAVAEFERLASIG